MDFILLLYLYFYITLLLRTTKCKRCISKIIKLYFYLLLHFLFFIIQQMTNDFGEDPITLVGQFIRLAYKIGATNNISQSHCV